ncbi:TPA: hypothetical protein ACQ65G_000752 [Neisseria meningitidis]
MKTENAWVVLPVPVWTSVLEGGKIKVCPKRAGRYAALGFCARFFALEAIIVCLNI